MGLHADIPSRHQIERLPEARGGLLVSIYSVGAEAADREALDDLHDDLDFWRNGPVRLPSSAIGVAAQVRLPNRLTAVQAGDRYYVKPLPRTVTSRRRPSS